MTDAKRFRSVMALNGQNQNDGAELLGITPVSVSRKLNGESHFTQDEIMKLASAWELTGELMVDIFFKEQ